MSESDCSSAAEERHARQARMQQNGAAALPAAAAAAASSSSSSSTPPSINPPHPMGYTSDLLLKHDMRAATLPMMKSMSELMRDCVTLQQNVNGTPVCYKQQQDMLNPRALASMGGGAAAASSSSSSSTPVVNQRKRRAAHAADGSSEPSTSFIQQALDRALAAQAEGNTYSHTWLSVEWEARFAKLEVPEFYNHSSLNRQAQQSNMKSLLEREQLFLPEQTAELESDLLQEAGTFVNKNTGKTVIFPECRNGPLCVSMHVRHFVRNQKKGVQLTSVLFAHEYDNLLNGSNVLLVSRPCVMCCRFMVTDCLCFDRSLRMNGMEAKEGDTVLPVMRKVESMLQFYQNPCDRSGGYRSIHMLRSNNSPDDPIIQPICTPGRSVLRMTESTVWFDASTKRPRMIIDQSAIIWKSNDIAPPSVGQNLLSFCSGASAQSKVKASSTH
jgi:hypothetical protein